jgi:multiple sugar transport system permease protein
MEPIRWLSDPEWALVTLIIFGVWGGLAFKIVVFMAGLQNIDKQLYQAAKIDGASRLKTFFRITLPMLAPIVAYISIISLIGSIKVYVEIIGLFGGGAGGAGPLNSALSIVYYVYQKFYQENLYPIAAAASVLMFVFILIITFVQLWINKRRLSV